MARETEILGLSELSDLLQNETKKHATDYLRRVAVSAGKVAQAAMEDTAPVATGRLESEIVVKSKFSGGADETTLTVEIGPSKDTWYSIFSEFGTVGQEGTDKHGRHFRHAATPAQHWIARAWEGCQEDVLNEFYRKAIELLMRLEKK